MENLKTVVMAVCGVSAARCIIGSIASASKLKDQVMMIMNLILGIVIAAPFASGFSGFSLPEIGSYELADYDCADDPYARSLAAETSANVSGVLKRQIEAAGIYCEKIETDVNISADYSISISRVTVTSGDFEAAAEIVKSSLGRETEVINGVR